jgi:hypothetical protein
MKELAMELRKFNENFSKMQHSINSVLSMTVILHESLESFKVTKTEMHVMASTFNSVALNLEAAVKNLTMQQPTMSATSKFVEPQPEKAHTENEQRIVNDSLVIYEKHFAKHKFKGMTKEVYCQINLTGGFKSFMDKMYPNHTITNDTFPGISKGASIKYYQILDRELIRLTSPMHKQTVTVKSRGRTQTVTPHQMTLDFTILN